MVTLKIQGINNAICQMIGIAQIYGNNMSRVIFLLCGLVFMEPRLLADDTLGSGIDCSEVNIDYMDDPEYTDSERLAEMDRAFLESVNRFELCYLSNQSGSAQVPASAATQGSEGQGEETNSDGTEGGETAFESVAEPLLTGTETETDTDTEPESVGSTPATVASTTVAPQTIIGSSLPDHDSTQKNGTIPQDIVVANQQSGAIPEDIPNVDNDDVVAEQIRLAATIETDPVKREKLWNEYRRYKGLAVKENAK